MWLPEGSKWKHALHMERLCLCVVTGGFMNVHGLSTCALCMSRHVPSIKLYVVLPFFLGGGGVTLRYEKDRKKYTDKLYVACIVLYRRCFHALYHAN